MILMAYDDPVKAVALSAARERMTAGWAWLIPEPLAAGSDVSSILGWLSFQMAGWVWSEGLNAWTQKVQNSTKSLFNFNALQCLDRNDTSKYGTTCAESLQFCQKSGINWDSPPQTNSDACPGMHTCMRARVLALARAHARARVCVFVFVCVCLCVCVCLYACMHVCVHVCMPVCMCVCTCMRACMYVCMNMCVRARSACMHVCVCVL